MSTRNLAMLCLLSFAALASPSRPAVADENRFAVVTVYNQTGNIDVRSLEYRWGENGPWRRVEQNFTPNREEYFYVELDGNGNAPNLYVRLNEAIGAAAKYEKEFRLPWNAAPDRLPQFGHKYALRRDQNDPDYISFVNLGN
jgi:hypothetical protein